MKVINKILISALLSLSLTSCSLGLFDKDNTPPPSPLVNFTPDAKVKSYWYTRTGFGVGKDYLSLVPAINNNTVYTADNSGYVTATDKMTGNQLWQTQSKIAITGGVGAGDGIVVVAGREGNIIALNQVNGKVLWIAKTSSEILAAPAVNHRAAVVKTIDGKITAYATQDGHLLWSYQQVEPNLILRGASSPQLTNEYAVVGFANGNLIKLTLQNGSLLWQKTMAIPEGSFAIQRMIDIDANPLLHGPRIYAATYQGRISALELSTGQDIWTHDLSSYTGIAADDSRVYVTDAKSHVWAFDSKGGSVNWRQTQLEARNITAPVVMGNYIVVGDTEGYLHWLNKEDGHFIARTRVNRSGIIAAPIVDNNTLYVLTKDGHLAAYGLG
jgi:outer membrane protein assembly factor BamB